MTKNRMRFVGLISVGILLVLFPLLSYVVDFGAGTDDSATELVVALRPEIEPWYHHIGIIPTDGTEPLLFSLQMLVGVGLFGYCFYRLMKDQEKDLKE